MSILVLFAVSTHAGKEHLVPFAVLARAGKEHLGAVCSFSAGKERLLSPFRLVRTRSFGCHLLCSCERGALVSPFRLVQTKSIGVAFYARVDQERWCFLLCSCGPEALLPYPV
ncbi:hypothetical protein ACFX1X_002493 [Malus domestica]